MVQGAAQASGRNQVAPRTVEPGLRLQRLAALVAAGPSIARRRPSKAQIVVEKGRPAPPTVPYPNGRNEATVVEHTTTAAKAMPRKAATDTSAVESEASAVDTPSTCQAAALSSASASAASQSHGVGRH
jgi:hypothetical protein